MLRASKILIGVVLGANAMVGAPPAAHAQIPPFQPQILLLFNGQKAATFTGHGGKVTSGTMAVGTFMVTITGMSEPNGKAPPMTANLTLTANVTGGGANDTLTILLTDTGYRQKGPASFADNVMGTITGLGSVSFQAFLDFSDTPFGMTGGSLPVRGPFSNPRPTTGPTVGGGNGGSDASYSGGDSTMVTDTAPYSMTLESVISGGDVTFTFSATNTPNR